MRRLITLVLILIFLPTFSFAQQIIQENGDLKDKGKTMKKQMKSHTVVYFFLMNATTLDLSDSQRQELDDIKNDYLYPMIKKEADFQIFQMKVMDMLKDPNFDPEKVKATIEISIKLTLENAIMSIDALAAIRKAVGVDNFNKLIEMMKSNDMAKKEGGSSSEHEEYRQDQQGI